MKVLFLQETGYSEFIGVMCLSALLKENGHHIDLLIFAEEKNVYQKIKDFDPDLIAFSCTTDMHDWIIKTARECKKRFKVPIILGGPHPTCYPEVIKNLEIDMICIGEGEYSLLELANRIEKGEGYFDIPGIWVKKGKKVFKNQPAMLIQDFSRLPIPDREIYYKYPFLKNMPMKRFITGRGCPYNCAFCHNQILKKTLKGKGKYVRKIPVETVIKEILTVKTNYPLTSVHISDDTFILDRKWLFEFLKTYKERVNLPFSCNIRADLIDKKVALSLRRANCRAVSFGVESGNETIRNKILNKRLDNKTILRAVELLRKNKIKFLTTNMFGIPGEEEEDIWATLELNRKVKPAFTRAFVFDAYPRLPLTQIAIEKGHLRKDYSLADFKALSHEPIIKNVNKNLIKNTTSLFYLLVKIPIPISLVRSMLRMPYNNAVSVVGRISQAFVEAKFFNIPLFSGLNYFRHVFSSFKSS